MECLEELVVVAGRGGVGAWDELAEGVIGEGGEFLREFLLEDFKRGSLGGIGGEIGL